MGNMAPAQQYLSSYTFSTMGARFAEHFLTVIAADQDLDSLLLNREVIGSENFFWIGRSGFSAAVMPLAEGTHSIKSNSGHGITVDGFNDDDSYLYTGGASFQFFNSVGDVNPPRCRQTSEGNPLQVTGFVKDRRPGAEI